MTYKYAFFGIPQGSAKAGLCLDYGIAPERKAETIKAAARHLKPLICRSTIWSAWTDMNFYGEDLKLFYAEMGRNFTPNPHHNSSHRTAISAFWSLEACMAFYKMSPGTTRLTIEGFGSVATYLAPYLKDLGVKVVAVSTYRGTVANPQGLDLAYIVSQSNLYGPDWIDREGYWQRLDRDALFDIETDIMVPCARVHSIGPERATRIPTRLVLPIANVLCTDAALTVFDQRGIDYVPDFVVNGGGVNGHIKDIIDPFGELFKTMFHRLLKTAHANRKPIRKEAEEVAHSNYGRLVSEAYSIEPLQRKIYERLSHEGLLPKFLVQKSQREKRNSLYSSLESLFSLSI
jgi:glutamate dehydrogenase (NAD(P)+)